MDARQILLDPDVAYLNSGAFGPVTHRAYASVTQLRRQLAENPSEFLLRRVPSLLWHARERLASFLGGDPRRLLFTTNVTEAANLVAHSLRLVGQGEILMSDQEYQTMRWCWERIAARRGLTINIFHLPPRPTCAEDIVSAAVRAMTDRTRLIFLSHIVSSNGLILPVEDICRIARRNGILSVIDGAHAPGQVPVDLKTLPCDAYLGSGHKWLLAPVGTGFVHLGADLIEAIEPLLVSWGYRMSASGEDRDRPDQFGTTPHLRRLECQGTRDFCPWLAVPDAIDALECFPMTDRLDRMRNLAFYTRVALQDQSGLECITPQADQLSAAMTSFAMYGFGDTLLLHNWLWQQHRIEVALMTHEGGQILRVSTHVFNTEAEIDRLADVLRRFPRRS
jgi:isopenicillin-N epimerase